MRKAIASLALICVAGCTTVRTVYVEVPVPVPVPCKQPPPVLPPELPELSPDATDAETIVLLYTALVQVIGHDAALMTLLDGYRVKE